MSSCSCVKAAIFELTPAGEYFIQHSKTILNDLDALRRNTALIHSGVEQELTIAVNNIIPRSAIVEFVCAFEQAFPSTRLTIDTAVYNGCWDALYGKRANLVIGAPHAVPSTEGIVSESIGHLEWDFVVGPQHPLAIQVQPLQNSELRQYPAICIRDTAVNFVPQQAWLLEGQKPMFVPDFRYRHRIDPAQRCHWLCAASSGAPLAECRFASEKPMQEHKHATQIFFAARSDGMGKVSRWCMDYLLAPAFRARLHGQL